MPHLPGQLEGIRHHRGEIAVGLQLKNLRADVGMQATHLGPAALLEVLEHPYQLVGIKAELAVEVAGADVFVSVALDPRGEAQHQLLDVEPVVGHHRHPQLHRQAQLLEALVVAVEHDALWRHAALHSSEQLTGGHSIEAQTFGGHHGCDRQAAVGLGGVKRQG